MKLTIDANEVVLGWLGEQLDRPGKVRPRRRLAPDDVRCTRELADRLDAMATDLGARKRYVADLPVLAHRNGVIFAVAAGTSWIALRLPEHGHAAVARSAWGRRGLTGDWVDVNPWVTEQLGPEGLRQLRRWCRAASMHAEEIGAG